ncbi:MULTISPECIES: CsbD family protein [unclassified Bosea (in: a-proteobacteria)]|uniref:CsbD family protein n=1 Tax=unclassified Bosea (in: a-proteobacteria) TaxID=2653178 RepID=UPI000953FEB6|nr:MULTISPECIES: CsbD family protein [unclassified Bosea (in: a-proteobacteria)]TAJ33559.1 MAG: CsbD family protein [Bosea sp. (in: a-proteobacteria)]SIR54558.1 CsbD-like [Bosea sp. TND4EK4]
MGSTMDKVKGMANEATGNVKQAAGKAVNKPEWEAEGKAQEMKGEAQQALGKGKDAVKNVVDKA